MDFALHRFEIPARGLTAEEFEPRIARGGAAVWAGDAAGVEKAHTTEDFITRNVGVAVQQQVEPGSGAEKYEPGGTSEGVQVGSRKTAPKKASFAALPPRERAVIEQSQSEKYPEEYGAPVEQYLLNLANESSAKK